MGSILAREHRYSGEATINGIAGQIREAGADRSWARSMVEYLGELGITILKSGEQTCKDEAISPNASIRTVAEHLEIEIDNKTDRILKKLGLAVVGDLMDEDTLHKLDLGHLSPLLEFDRALAPCLRVGQIYHSDSGHVVEILGYNNAGAHVMQWDCRSNEFREGERMWHRRDNGSTILRGCGSSVVVSESFMLQNSFTRLIVGQEEADVKGYPGVSAIIYSSASS
jgi:hypothetical protein